MLSCCYSLQMWVNAEECVTTAHQQQATTKVWSSWSINTGYGRSIQSNLDENPAWQTTNIKLRSTRTSAWKFMRTTGSKDSLGPQIPQSRVGLAAVSPTSRKASPISAHVQRQHSWWRRCQVDTLYWYIPSLLKSRSRSTLKVAHFSLPQSLISIYISHLPFDLTAISTSIPGRNLSQWHKIRVNSFNQLRAAQSPMTTSRTGPSASTRLWPTHLPSQDLLILMHGHGQSRSSDALLPLISVRKQFGAITEYTRNIH